MQITAKDPKSGNSATIEYNLGNNLSEAVERFGEDVVFSNYKAKAVITLQAAIRGWLRQGLTPEQIQEKANAYKLGVVHRAKKDPKAKLMDMFAKMTDEEKKAFLRELKGK